MTDPARRPDVAAIYFPSWHADPRRDEKLGPGWTEWELIRAGRPRFPGHYQPIVPQWGYLDETEPANMRRSLQVAGRYGIDAFLWDWYFYDGDDFLNRPLDETYLALDEPEVKFALMWANHTWIDVFPLTSKKEPEVWFPGAVDLAQFRRLVAVVVERYLSSPYYWRVDGAAWFTVFHIQELLDGLGGVEAAAAALTEFRAAAEAAGVGPLHLNAMGGWQQQGIEVLAALGFDSFGPYNWSDLMPRDQGIEVDYARWRADAAAQWRADQDAADALGLSYIPNLTMGWDSTTRVDQDDQNVPSSWPMLPVVTGNTPAEFGAAAADLRAFLDSRPDCPALTVNAWNEWTEGSYLEPDERYGLGYLEALHAALPGRSDQP
ncbi:glycoside hydrolase family 99-like domain-containing protein [Microlunatus panaciterrae]|uniref:Glycosyltransferase WbsX n=1 Tax=Microlunatus panaciterrae TaxID=400768 RepID=A0ABS2RMH3_9ACTN|nr:glycoside hydrolase family 99-like domain-containing protein [Microlunatus panaciterrae]MBM7799702.1 hypothetical protein [Microlunatus panaciterrae]